MYFRKAFASGGISPRNIHTARAGFRRHELVTIAARKQRAARCFAYQAAPTDTIHFRHPSNPGDDESADFMIAVVVK